MNCKPGDLAIVVAPYGNQALRGTPVTVLRRAYDGELIAPKVGVVSMQNDAWGFGPGWVCDGHSAHLPLVIADRCLRPLRDPGSSARDETLDWLPVPSVTKEVA